MIKENLPFKEYTAAPGVNQSSFSHIDPERDGCPALWKAHEDGNGEEEEDTDALSFGRLFHSYALTPNEFARETVVETDEWQAEILAEAQAGGSRSKKFSRNLGTFKAAKAKMAAEGKELISEGLGGVLQAMLRGAIDCVPVAGILGADDTQFELSLFGELRDHQGRPVACKGRLDALRPGSEVMDLKTVASAAPSALGRFIPRWKLHVQAAYYLDLCEAAGLERPPIFSWAFIDKRRPYPTVYYRADDAMIDLGRQEYKGFLGWINDGRESGKWSGHSHMIDLPNWYQSLLEEVA